MTPKEKAIELVDEYWCVYYAQLAEDFTDKYIKKISKKCALICVDEILENVDYVGAHYWQEVKQEIQKI